MEPILSVKDLSVSFHAFAGTVHAVRDVNFDLMKGETLAIVGESGSGKSVTAYSIMRILESNGGIKGGHVFYKGDDITKFSEKQMREFRGKCCSIIFQDPMTSLNPVYTIEKQLNEVYLTHQKVTKKEASAKSLEMLNVLWKCSLW